MIVMIFVSDFGAINYMGIDEDKMDKSDGKYLGLGRRNECCRQHRLTAKLVEETPPDSTC